MGTVDAKAFFRLCRRLPRRMEAKAEEQERVRAMGERCTAAYSTEPRGGSGPTSKVENAAVRLADLSREIGAEADRLAEHYRIAVSIIARLADDRHRDILTWRYINGWGWERIMVAMEIESRWAHTLHSRALAEAQKIIDRTALPQWIVDRCAPLDDLRGGDAARATD